MAAVSELITLGIGTPSDIPHFLLVGLSPKSAVTVNLVGAGGTGGAGVIFASVYAPQASQTSWATGGGASSLNPVRRRRTVVERESEPKPETRLGLVFLAGAGGTGGVGVIRATGGARVHVRGSGGVGGAGPIKAKAPKRLTDEDFLMLLAQVLNG